jgi:UPF0716 protein FxsA
MALLLVIVFLVAPLVELALIVQVASTVGIPNTIGLLVAVSLVGAWLARREGIGVLRRIEAALRRGEMPSKEVADGGLILLAGALMIAPGFISDVLAILLLLPPSRAVVRGIVLGYVARRGTIAVTSRFGGYGAGAGRIRTNGRSNGHRDVWDVDSWEEPPHTPPRGELGDRR